MGFSKKGARGIIVNGMNFLWKISAKRTNAQEFGNSPIIVAIQLGSDEGSKLIVNTNMAPPLNYVPYDERFKFRSITPIDIEMFIQQAIQSGWKPKENGKPFVLEIDLKN